MEIKEKLSAADESNKMHLHTIIIIIIHTEILSMKQQLNDKDSQIKKLQTELFGTKYAVVG